MFRLVLGPTALALLLPLAELGARKASAENLAAVEVTAKTFTRSRGETR